MEREKKKNEKEKLKGPLLDRPYWEKKKRETKQIMEEEKINKLLEKLGEEKNPYHFWDNWTEKEQLQVLELYYKITKNEARIFDLIWRNQDTQTWEHLFLHYSEDQLQFKNYGVERAIENFCIDMETNTEE